VAQVQHTRKPRTHWAQLGVAVSTSVFGETMIVCPYHGALRSAVPSRRRRPNTLNQAGPHYGGLADATGKSSRTRSTIADDVLLAKQTSKMRRRSNRLTGQRPDLLDQPLKICYLDRKRGIIMGLLRHSHGLTIWSAARRCGCSVWRRQPGILPRRLNQ
jgi:hypothetical protein